MGDSLMPSKDSGGNKMVILLLVGGAVLLIVAGVLVFRERVAKPADIEAPVQVTKLVAPQPTKPAIEPVDTGEAPETDEDKAPEQKTKKRKPRKPSAPQSPIDAAKYNAFINSRFGQVRACYERRLKVNALLEGKVDVNISVNDRGRVNSITVNRDTVGDREMLTCVKKTVKSWEFPEPEGGGVVLAKTFMFKKKGS